MQHYEFPKRLKALYDKAVNLYARGGRDVTTFFDAAETAFLHTIGAIPMEIYDFAEDANNDGEPDWETALLVQSVRRDFFLQVQRGRHSTVTIPASDFPAKEDEAGGVAWLPRLILKAKSKLRGELPADLMYGCGGDRKFFREHDIHPAEFLRLTWGHLDDEAAIVGWVLERKKTVASV